MLQQTKIVGKDEYFAISDRKKIYIVVPSSCGGNYAHVWEKIYSHGIAKEDTRVFSESQILKDGQILAASPEDFPAMASKSLDDILTVMKPLISHPKPDNEDRSAESPVNFIHYIAMRLNKKN